MISSSIQILSWFVSLIIGSIYYFYLKFILCKINSKNIILKFSLDVIYVLFFTYVVINVYYKLNGGYIHYSYPIFYLIGYLISYKVNMNVKLLKKTIFSKKK